jgi:ferredoxin-thioredoxin reductase catalytic chain
MISPGGPEIDLLRKKLTKKGYFFNPEKEMTDSLLASLLVNQARYGYQFCPCRLATGDYNQDKDAVCPCDVRDWDIYEFGTCFCGLYVSQEAAMENKDIQSIPDRRGMDEGKQAIWRCQVCGYLSARPHPPDTCPICGVSRDRFEPFDISL